MKLETSNAALELELQTKGATFTPVELALPADLAIDEWAAIGRRLVRSEQVLKWWVGDWAAFGVRKYGKLKEFAEANGMDYGTLRNLAWVSNSIELSRRRDNVEWSKHAEVAALPAKDQTKWLERIEEEELPRAELRRQIRASQGEQNALKSDGPTTKFVSKALDDLTHWLTSQAADFWTADRKALWKDRLKPLVKFYNSL